MKEDGTRIDKKERIFLGGVPNDCTIQEIENIFSSFGQVTDVALVKNPETGCSKGFAFFTLLAGKENLNKLLKQRFVILRDKIV